MNPVVRSIRHLARVIIRASLLAGWFRASRTSFSPHSRESAIVLVSLWNRPSRIVNVLELLDAQTHNAGVRLFLWNNQRKDHLHYRREIEEFVAVGSLCEVSIVKSPYNLGSISRFYWARKIARSEGAPPIIVLDDDQDVAPEFVQSALAQFHPHALTAWWAWKIDGDYYDRSPALRGERVDHIGPGGMVADSSLFLDGLFFTDIPDRWGLLDDIWLSHYAKRRRWTLEKLDAEIDFVMDETNQAHGQADVKREFYEFLRLQQGEQAAP